jgi:hypothetical protein
MVIVAQRAIISRPATAMTVRTGFFLQGVPVTLERQRIIIFIPLQDIGSIINAMAGFAALLIQQAEMCSMIKIGKYVLRRIRF